MNKCKIIAEIGCNHMGEIKIAKNMIDMATIFCNVKIMKFQKRNPKELLTEEEYNMPHPNPKNSFGNTYGQHREFLEFSIEQHKELKAYCEEKGAIYSVSVWDLTSAKQMVDLNPEIIKIPSACNLDKEILDCIINNYGGEIHISLGMTNREEEKRLVKYITDSSAEKRTVIYACTSGYPVDDKDVCLLEITRLIENYGKLFKAIGFSGHHNGIAIDLGARALGAEYIERHFTLDHLFKGTDHAASLMPDGLRRLTRDINCLEMALAYKKEEILEVEVAQRKKLKRLRAAL